jgi:glycosyltransferase involved in cell wall biosynthesis
MCLGLARAGARIHVVTTDADLEGRVRVPRRREESGMTVATLPVLGSRAARRYGFAPGLVPEIWRAAAHADLCVLQGIWTFLLLVGPRICRMRGLPYVIVPRGTLEEISLAEKASKKRLYLRLIERANLRHAAAVQFTSEQERARSGAAAGRPALVHGNAIELGPLLARETNALRRRLGVGEDALLAGISGRLHPRKGFDVIVPALARASARLHLVAFGADEAGYGRRITELARAAGVADRVHLLGQLDGAALDQTYAAIDLLVMPSHGESFGNTAIEALAQGTEVLLSETVPLGEWIEEYRLGRIVAERSPERWGAELDAWLARRERFDRARAAGLARERFDLAAAGRRLLADYRMLLSPP